jgi:hypothetical protein
MAREIRTSWIAPDIDINRSDRRAHRKPTRWKKSLRDKRS